MKAPDTRYHILYNDGFISLDYFTRDFALLLAHDVSDNPTRYPVAIIKVTPDVIGMMIHNAFSDIPGVSISKSF